MNLLKVKYISIYNRYFCFYVIIGVLSSIALNFRGIEFLKKSCRHTLGWKDDLGFQNEKSKMTIILIKLLGGYILFLMVKQIVIRNINWLLNYFDNISFVCFKVLDQLNKNLGREYYISIFLYKSS